MAHTRFYLPIAPSLLELARLRILVRDKFRCNAISVASDVLDLPCDLRIPTGLALAHRRYVNQIDESGSEAAVRFWGVGQQFGDLLSGPTSSTWCQAAKPLISAFP